MMAAIKDTIPDSKIFGCYFHLRQAVERQVQIKGIKKRASENESLRYAIDCFFVLCFIPIGFLEEVLKVFLFPLFDKTLPLEPLVQGFFLYLSSTYLSEFKLKRKVRKQTTTFSADTWNCVKNMMDGSPITNNGAEGFNSAYNMQQTTRPTVYTTIKGLY